MPSIAQAPPSPLLNARKRRRDFDEFGLGADAGMEVQMKLTVSPHKAHYQTTTLSHANQIIVDASERKHKIIRPHSKRARPSGLWDTQEPLDEVETGTQYITMPVEQKMEKTKIDLSPCHICHRKPSELRHLDDYTDCESCARRTCFVCIRQCEGLSVEEKLLDGGIWEMESAGTEHRGKVCSRCCVERGSEGEVWCLGCLRAEDGD